MAPNQNCRTSAAAASHVEGDGVAVTVHFGHDQIALHPEFLSAYQAADAKTLERWDGWIAISPRVEMSIGAAFIEFKCAGGASYFLWRSEIDRRLPPLHSIPPGDDCNCIVRLKADGDLQIADIIDPPAPPSPLDKLTGLVSAEQIGRAAGVKGGTILSWINKDRAAPKPRGRQGESGAHVFDADEVRAWLKASGRFVG